MLIWDDAVSLAEWMVGDSGTTTDTMCKLIMNQSYKQILNKFRGKRRTQDTMTRASVEDQRNYMLPPRFIRPISVSYEYGDRVTDLVHIQNEDMWNRFIETDQTSTRPERYFIKYRFGVGGAELHLDPIPSDDEGTIKIVFDSGDRDLSATAYTTGTVTLTNDSTAVVGSGTTFTNAMVGRYLTPTAANDDGNWYRISAFTSTTAISLEQSYAGTTYSGTYKIAEAFALPEDMQIMPVYAFCQHYFSMRNNDNKVAEFKALYDDAWIQGLKNYASKDANPKIFDASIYNAGFEQYPANFPTNVTE